ncbi:MAG TPA: ferric reductase-like transmembrane domain-containing protein, partial [Gammaproteobacteria bacterium]|nr:ferric reductase-like transmembrane domain-containing protein [Gammaproteobacteria bacterium]
MRPWQAVLILVAISFVLTAAAVPAATWPTSATLSLASGVAALTLMAAAAVLGGRWSLVESAFGGLDRVYRAHKWMGIWALALASFHLVFKAEIDGWTTASILEMPPYYTRLVRQLAFVALMFIVMLALNRNIPYNVWRWWHKLSGPLFLLVILHWLSFKSPIALASPAGIWLAAASLLGVTSAAYKLLLYPFLAHHAEYRVVDLHPGDNAIHLQLMPVKRAVQFQPGQFGFLRMKQEGLWEPHPFTIASGTSPDGRVDFVVRGLGDYTSKLAAKTAIGMRADIYAPYGRFRRPTQAQREIWIGGGVGISPFISWLQDESAGGFDRVT